MRNLIKSVVLFGKKVSFKECSKCSEIKKVESFYNLKSSSCGKMSQCKSCHNESTRKWTEAIKSKHDGKLETV
jgi:hypothetical protein